MSAVKRDTYSASEVAIYLIKSQWQAVGRSHVFFDIGVCALGSVGVRVAEMLYFGDMSPDPLQLGGTLFSIYKRK